MLLRMRLPAVAPQFFAGTVGYQLSTCTSKVKSVIPAVDHGQHPSCHGSPNYPKTTTHLKRDNKLENEQRILYSNKLFNFCVVTKTKSSSGTGQVCT